MLALHTPGDGTANYSHFLKGISDAPKYILRSPLSVHTNVISNFFFKKSAEQTRNSEIINTHSPERTRQRADHWFVGMEMALRFSTQDIRKRI